MKYIYSIDKSAKQFLNKNIKDVFYSHVENMPVIKSVTPLNDHWLEFDVNFAAKYNRHYGTKKKFHYAIVENGMIIDYGYNQ